ncbi:hypothetical protein J4468_04520 [Candidatus Woesearchaeota archaeon]|nr:hypothetical protein [Candidatus Woesearchaeota archaeon]
MHVKIIKGKEYYYTSVRDHSGKIKTIYLGRNKEEAETKEKDLFNADLPSDNCDETEIKDVRENSKIGPHLMSFALIMGTLASGLLMGYGLYNFTGLGEGITGAFVSTLPALSGGIPFLIGGASLVIFGLLLSTPYGIVKKISSDEEIETTLKKFGSKINEINKKY